MELCSTTLTTTTSRRMGSLDQLEIPKVDFSGLDPDRPGGNAWNAARDQVMQALKSASAFEAVYDHRITPAVREALFGDRLKDAFKLPLETKMRNSSDKPYHGYVGPTSMEGAEFETFAINSAEHRDSAEAFTRLLWPDGKPSFTDAVHGMAKPLSELEQMVRRMVAESLGIEKHFDELVQWSNSVLRLTQYQAPPAGEKIGLHTHTDMGFLSLICQHRNPGLQVETQDGGWALPSLNSVTVIVGDAFSVWTNGTLEPCVHRVIITGPETRYAAILSVFPKDEYAVKPPEELIDEEHPLRFKTFNHVEYFRFYFSEKGLKAKTAVKAFCGIGEDELHA